MLPGGCYGACAILRPSKASGAVDAKIADRALAQLEVDARGLDALDHRYLRCIAVNYSGGPVGIETIAAALSEPRDAIEEIIEPYLLQQGFIARTPRGRMLTAAAFTHLGLGPSSSASGRSEPRIPPALDREGGRQLAVDRVG